MKINCKFTGNTQKIIQKYNQNLWEKSKKILIWSINIIERKKEEEVSISEQKMKKSDEIYRNISFVCY